VPRDQANNHDHKGNAGWHFVNLPLGAAGYPAGSPTKVHYTQDRVGAASEQLVKAAVRLAALLNAIGWK